MIYRGNEKENHKGSIVSWPILKKNENDTGKDNPILRWEEGILLEPVNVQIVVTLEHGLRILSHGQYPLVEIVDADLWDESCDKKLEELSRADKRRS